MQYDINLKIKTLENIQILLLNKNSKNKFHHFNNDINPNIKKLFDMQIKQKAYHSKNKHKNMSCIINGEQFLPKINILPFKQSNIKTKISQNLRKINKNAQYKSCKQKILKNQYSFGQLYHNIEKTRINNQQNNDNSMQNIEKNYCKNQKSIIEDSSKIEQLNQVVIFRDLQLDQNQVQVKTLRQEKIIINKDDKKQEKNRRIPINLRLTGLRYEIFQRVNQERRMNKQGMGKESKQKRRYQSDVQKQDRVNKNRYELGKMCDMIKNKNLMRQQYSPWIVDEV